VLEKIKKSIIFKATCFLRFFKITIKASYINYFNLYKILNNALWEAAATPF